MEEMIPIVVSNENWPELLRQLLFFIGGFGNPYDSMDCLYALGLPW